ncbi:MAG: hypothetical protein M3458_01220 [Acidobacteriota bacterium]|nr:hypothetical protein [Acidobacteriota bacterium]
MKSKTENLLPKTMPGSVHQQYVHCGKATCKCARGELHGAYYYHFVRVDGKLKKRYLRATEAEQVEAACAARREHEREGREQTRQTWQSLRELRALLRGHAVIVD